MRSREPAYGRFAGGLPEVKRGLSWNVFVPEGIEQQYGTFLQAVTEGHRVNKKAPVGGCYVLETFLSDLTQILPVDLLVTVVLFLGYVVALPHGVLPAETPYLL